jgi:hypothetical protein
MRDLLEPLFVFTGLVYGVVIFAALRDSFKAICRAIRRWYERKWAAIQAGMNQVLDHKDPQIEARIASRERKCGS